MANGLPITLQPEVAISIIPIHSTIVDTANFPGVINVSLFIISFLMGIITFCRNHSFSHDATPKKQHSLRTAELLILAPMERFGDFSYLCGFQLFRDDIRCQATDAEIC